jgi:hypothetical protein
LLKSATDHSRYFELAGWPGVFCVYTNPEAAIAAERRCREVARLNGLAVESARYDLGRGLTQRVSVSGLEPSLMSLGMAGLAGFRGDKGGLGCGN